MHDLNRRRRSAVLFLVLSCAAFAAHEARAAGAWSTGGPPGADVRALAIDPATPSIVYASVWDLGLLKSTDAGTTWAPLTRSGLSRNVSALTIDPVTPQTLYAISGDAGVMKSTDAGSSWARANVSGMPLTTVGALVIDPTAPATLYQSHRSTVGGIYKSTSGGTTWSPAMSGLPANPSVRSLAIAPAVPVTLYAGLESGAGGVFKSTNGGLTWNASSVGLPAPAQVNVVTIAPANPAILYCTVSVNDSVFKSTDAGATWSSGASVGAYVRVLAVDPGAPATVYAATFNGGVYKSTDSAGSWSPVNAGLTPLETSALAIHPSSAATLYVGTSTGAFKSTNSAVSWAEATAVVKHRSIYALARDPSVPGTLYAGGSVALFKSTDFGATWALSNTGMEGESTFSLAVDPVTPTTVYAGANFRVKKSTNAGASWADTSTGFPAFTALSMVIDPTAPATVYAASTSAGVRKSTNGGASWFDAHLGVPDVSGFIYATAIVLAPSAPAMLYLGTQSGAYRSTDGAGTWYPMGPDTRPVWSLAVDPTTATTVYAGTPNGVFKSTDGGATWSAARAGLPYAAVQALVVDPSAPATLYAAMSGGYVTTPMDGGHGVYRSTDAGSTWASIGAGFRPGISPTTLLLDTSAGTRLYAGFFGDSVWQASPPPAAFLKGDLDGDGARDLAFRSNVDGAHNKLWLMNGVARTSEAAITPDAASADWKIRGIDDFDSDGRNDLVFWNQATGNVEFWIMNGAVRVGAPVPLSGGPVLDPGWDLAATADFDHDGAPDLLWRNFNSQKIVVWTMNGARKTGSRVPTPDQAVDGNWAIVAALDYNNDNTVDLLWYNATSGRAVTWYLDAAFARVTGQFTNPMAAGDNNWRVVASSDYSGTSVPGTPPLGSQDIVWRNETSGNQVVWHMDFASTRVHGEFTTPTSNAPALDWTIVGPR